MLQSSAPHRNVFQVVLLLQNEQLTHTSFPFHVYFNSGFNFHYFFQGHVSNYALATLSMVVFLTLTIMPLICSLKQQIFIEHTVHTEHFSGAGAVVENTTDNGLALQNLQFSKMSYHLTNKLKNTIMIGRQKVKTVEWKWCHNCFRWLSSKVVWWDVIINEDLKTIHNLKVESTILFGRNF